MDNNNKIRIFTPFIFFSISWLLIPAIQESSKLIHFYVILLEIVMLLSFYWLNKKDLSTINHISRNYSYKSEKIILIAFTYTILLVYLISKGENFTSYFTSSNLFLDRQIIRDTGTYIPYYSLIFKNFALLIGAISLHDLWNKKYINSFINAIPYFLFFLASASKGPIACFVLLMIFVYYSSGKVNIYSIIFFIFLIFSTLFFIFKTTYGNSIEFGFDSILPLFNAIWLRVKLAGELVIFGYEYFLNESNLAGATFPILLGLLDLNLLYKKPIEMGPLINYKLRGSYLGNANTSFLVDGFANLGLGGGYLFLLLVLLYLYYLLKYFIYFIKSSYFREIYKFFIMINVIDLISVSFWLPLESSIVAFCVLFGIEQLINLSPKSLNSNIQFK